MPPAPLVSLLTPTFNRRPWFPQLARCVLAQTYPRRARGGRVEWIILDDGTEPVGAAGVLPGPPPDWLEVRYVRLEERLPLGEKRNRLHALARGDIAIYFDDDDYHFPDRVLHSVQTLQRNPRALAAGCSELPIWFLPEGTLQVVGPFSGTHATCGTMAVRRELFQRRAFEPTAMSAEEAAFLDQWRVPLVQLDPWRVILCIAHARNTVEKRAVRDRLAERGGTAGSQPHGGASGPVLVRDCAANPLRLVADAASREFYARGLYGTEGLAASGPAAASGSAAASEAPPDHSIAEEV